MNENETKSIKKILEEYKDTALDFSQPALFEILKLSVQYPNDTEFGSHVRALVNKAEAHRKQMVKELNDIALLEILNASAVMDKAQTHHEHLAKELNDMVLKEVLNKNFTDK